MNDKTTTPVLDEEAKAKLYQAGAMIIEMEIAPALQAGMVMRIADMLFRELRPAFRYAPEHTLTYRALRALEDRAIVSVAEMLQRSPHLFAQDEELIAFKIDLKNHRHVISHPHHKSENFIDKKVRAFHESGRHRADVKTALLLGFVRHVRARTGAPTSPIIWRVDDETPALLLGILSVTRNPAGSTGLPTEDELREALRGSARRFEELLQNHTDSKPTPA